jgi:hypothetical protein
VVVWVEKAIVVTVLGLGVTRRAISTRPRPAYSRYSAEDSWGSLDQIYYLSPKLREYHWYH